MRFPPNFILGAATSSYQIEGAPYHDGGGESVWDMMGHKAGKITNGDTGDIACDHYHRYKDDVSMMSDIGLQAYRFSISWPRVLPDGAGQVNQKGLDFYDLLVDELLANNIDPWLTLFHWDFPFALYTRGGWLNRDSADWFADYTMLIVDRLSDRVKHWSTLNEPQCFIGLGHQDGVHAPGKQLPMADVLLCAHNAMRAHGKAVQVIRANAKSETIVGASQASLISIPESNKTVDIEAARQHMFSISDKQVFNNVWFSDPMILGDYPHEAIGLFAGEMPENFQDDLECIHQPLDYFGTNIYSGIHVRSAGKNESSDFVIAEKEDLAVTSMGWPIIPEALYWGPKFFHERYQLPIVVTESGMADDDKVDNGRVNDRERVDFLCRYMTQYANAIEEGVPALGYFVWSLMDNFEWAEGYEKRFGIVYVNYATQQRILKDSAHWYKKLITEHVTHSSNRSTEMSHDETIVEVA